MSKRTCGEPGCALCSEVAIDDAWREEPAVQERMSPSPDLLFPQKRWIKFTLLLIALTLAAELVIALCL